MLISKTFMYKATKKLFFTFFILFAIEAQAKYRKDLWIPQTHTLDPGQVQISVSRQAAFQKKDTDPVGYGHESMLGASFGIWENGPVGVEAGVEWIEPARSMVTQGLYGHLRVRVSKVDEKGWSVALGIEKLGFVTNRNDHNIIYAALQNKIGERWYTEVGGYNGSARFLIDQRGKPDTRGTFLGIWRQIQMGRGRIGVEYTSGFNYLGFIFTGMTLELSDSVYGTIGYGYANNQKLNRDWVLSRITVDF